MESRGPTMTGLDGRRGGTQAFFQSMGIAASGLSAQRARIEVIAENIANAETTRTTDGLPYRRKTVQLEEVPFARVMEGRAPGAVSPTPPSLGPSAQIQAGGVRVMGSVEDPTEGPAVYDPGHPDADQDGYVRMPNVRITDEMVDLMQARRLYEANASVFEAVKAMLRRATQL